jgi:hypothetical protein
MVIGKHNVTSLLNCVLDCKNYVKDVFQQTIPFFSSSFIFQIPWWQMRFYHLPFLRNILHQKPYPSWKDEYCSWSFKNLIASDHTFITWLQRFNLHMVNTYQCNKSKENVNLNKYHVCTYHNFIQYCVQRDSSLQATNP